MSGFPPDLRARSLAALRDSTIDVLILGGGINGAGIARDLGLRRQSNDSLQVALVDKGHFASGTSGRNSQLIHGGLRYLKYLKMGLVKESLRERAVLRQIAPHLVEPLAFLMPIYSRIDKLKYTMGLSMYDQLAGDSNISRHREVSKGEIAQLEPSISTKGLVGGAIFYDCQVHSARFVLENLFDAALNGVHLANYVEGKPVERMPDGMWRVQLTDLLTGEGLEVRAKKVVDATGPWSQPGESAPRLVRGSHIILNRLTAEEHALAYFDDNGRIVFFIPWGSQKQLTLLGTTDVEHKGNADDARISQEEVDYLLSIAQKLYPNAGSLKPLGAFSSLRPLVSDGSSSATEATREHKIWNTKDNILRIQGGKYTIYRQMSEEAVNAILKELSPWLATPSHTATQPLCGNTPKALERLRHDANSLSEQYRLSPADVESVIREYGLHTPDVLAMTPEEDFGSIRRTEFARIAFAVQHEMAVRLADILLVSTYIGYDRHWDMAQLEPYAYLVGSWMGWDSARQHEEAQDVLQRVGLPGAGD
ncbi:MAG: glycerol-3-phosphate dehydrogenase/oxidase [Acidobacteria bacterium]|nr:glycerol-3-phosphate dehydrogenase/oxidase [Acidobacteriota bacterium]